MNSVKFWFHSSFNGLLSAEYQGGEFSYEFKGEPSVKHLVEAMRIPHTEIGKIIVNEQEVNLSYLAQDGDLIKVYPVLGNRSYHSEVGEDSKAIDARFVLDNHLGKLATYLRMLGFDTLYHNNFQDDELAELASKERRILLTRDRGLLMRRSIEYGYFVRSMDAKEQLVEVIQQYEIINQVRPFERCLRCNERLKHVEKIQILDRLEPLTQKYYNEFSICPDCEKIYWKGSHYERMQGFIRTLDIKI
jgi:hypothetical protein